MITLDDYFDKWRDQATDKHRENAVRLLYACNQLHDKLIALVVTFPYNNKTGSLISGTQYGGFRPQDCCEGAPNSAHKQGLAVDIYDPRGEIDLTLYNHQYLLDECGLYIEHPEATKGWSHWSIRAPKSGRRVFYP